MSLKNPFERLNTNFGLKQFTQTKIESANQEWMFEKFLWKFTRKNFTIETTPLPFFKISTFFEPHKDLIWPLLAHELVSPCSL